MPNLCAIMGRGALAPRHFPITFLAKNRRFLSFEKEKCDFTTFSPHWKNFYGYPWKNPLWPPLEKIFPTPMCAICLDFFSLFPRLSIVTRNDTNRLLHFPEIILCHLQMLFLVRLKTSDSARPTYWNQLHGSYGPQHAVVKVISLRKRNHKIIA